MIKITLISVFILLQILVIAQQKTTFEIKGEQFLLNGKPYQVLSGEVHYFRTPQAYWKEVMMKAKAMGLNSITTYIYWGIHETSPGNFDFAGNLDLRKFILTAQEVGLHVILRPGPFICAAVDFGGLPGWLLRDRNMNIRCMDSSFLAASKRYIFRLGKELKDLQVTTNGPIIMLQVENEYGVFGNDFAYLNELDKYFKEAGFNIPFFMSNPPLELKYGNLPDCLPTINFLENAQQQFKILADYRSGIPRMCSEYWIDATIHWRYKDWTNKNAEVQYKNTEWMLKNGISISFYTFHGGTNFAFWSGADCRDKYEPYPTSYDNYSFTDESLKPTKEYYRMRELMVKYKPNGENIPDVPESEPNIAIPTIKFTQYAKLMDNLPKAKLSVSPKPMEDYGQYFGYILYRTQVPDRLEKFSGKLFPHDLNDYGTIYLNGTLVDTIDRTIGKNSATLKMDSYKTYTLDIFTESMGRPGFGVFMPERKGITESVELEHLFVLMNWETYCLPMNNDYLDKLKYTNKKAEGPAFYKAEFELAKTGDTYLDMRGWNKGFVVVNGHNLGRFWNVGPQYDLYLPGVYLKSGKNEILVFDVYTKQNPTVKGDKERRKTKD